MHRSSESIGRIAAALASAQRQLQNPEKSQTATLATSSGQGQGRSFRYASLASGLDIIRRTLGEHEIATFQSTALDRDLGLIRLNTVLAHSSGEWIASDWPVCPTADVNSPHRLGAALTYARRYALFTIVGIAGEDDLDAPDLDNERPAALTASKPFNGKPHLALSAEDSAALCARLLAELVLLKTLDDLTIWAIRHLNSKAKLLSDDVERLDQAYLGKLNEMGEMADRTPDVSKLRPERPPIVSSQKMIRQRSKSHLTFVAAQPCLICKRMPCDAHHLKFAQPRALGRKVSDEFTVPLCRAHHVELHRHSNERAWWANAGLTPLEVAAWLWDASQRCEAKDLGAPKRARKRAG